MDRARITTAVLLVASVPVVGVAFLRVLGIEGTRLTIPALALTPYAAVGGLLLAVVAGFFRRWVLAAGVLLLATWLVVLLLPRAIGNDQPPAEGPDLGVMSANLHFGDADAATVVRLVRDHKVDLLTLSELTPGVLSQLDLAGLADELPYRVVDPAEGAAGSGIVSRFPLRRIQILGDSVNRQPAAEVRLPHGQMVEIVAVHTPPPVRSFRVDSWRRELAALPPAAAGVVRILTGDFNATFDHPSFRDVVDRGYADAAEQTGEGLTSTWANWPLGPPLTLDHVLYDRRCAVADYAVLDLPGSDHAAVFAELTLP